MNDSKGWETVGTPPPITGTPEQYHQLAYWAGDASGTNNPLILELDAPKQVTAVFVQIVTEKLDVPHQWLVDQGFDLGVDDPETIASTDHDNDGYTTGQEYVLGTIPTRPNISIDPVALEFNTALSRLYDVDVSTNLISNHWNTAANNIPGTGENIAIPINKTQPATFYREKVRMAE